MKDILLNYFIKNKKNFIIITIVFCIGVIGGIIFINNSKEPQITEINTYIQELINNIKNSENINKLNLLFLSIKENSILILLIWFLGYTIIGAIFIYLLILYKGFCLGYTISALIAVLGVRQGTLVSIVTLLFQNIVFLFALFLISENRNKIM